MEAPFKIKQIQECGETALTPLVGGNPMAAHHLVLSRYTYAVLEKIKGALLKTATREDAPEEVRQDFQHMADGISLPAERAREEALLNIVSQGVELPNQLAGDIATGFAYAMVMATTAPVSRIALGLEKSFAAIKKQVADYRDKNAPAEMKEHIDVALKWLDAARLIATSDKPLTIEKAFEAASIQRQ